ncbi:MAG: adenylate/guanylate cyclase domain-containing protein [Planctomycetia bacterium]
MRFYLETRAANSGDVLEPRELTPGVPLIIGRADTSDIVVGSDIQISRNHARIVIDKNSDQLRVECLEQARNPLILNGRHRSLCLKPGNSFQIGGTYFHFTADGSDAAGKTSLFLRDDGAEEPRTAAGFAPIEATFTSLELNEVRFSDSAKQIELLAKLPERIAATMSEQDLARNLLDLYLEGIPEAAAVCVLKFNPDHVGAGGGELEPDWIEKRSRVASEAPFVPSRRFVRRALEARTTVVHYFVDSSDQSQFTFVGGFRWAFCAPIPGDACRGWATVVTGEGSRYGIALARNAALMGDLRFAELLNSFIGSFLSNRQLQMQQSKLQSFFSRKVIQQLKLNQSDAIEPREAEVTVLVGDLRGFSLQAEQLQHDLPTLLNRARSALNLMTGLVVKHNGAVADFRGDEILGFWGWPCKEESGPIPACRAALAMIDSFDAANSSHDQLLAGSKAGFGIAHGHAMAGEIGNDHLAKIGVFGPVVNLGARLQGMTKMFGIYLCVDESTVAALKQDAVSGPWLFRLLGRVQPHGMSIPANVYELRKHEPTMEAFFNDFTAMALRFMQGQWSLVRSALEQFPEEDGPAAFYRGLMLKYTQTPPSGWNGVIRLDSK